MTTSQKLAELIVSDPIPGRSGKIEAHRRTAQAATRSGSLLGTTLLPLLQEIEAQPMWPQTTKVAHPLQHAAVEPSARLALRAGSDPQSPSTPATTLSASDLEWLRRLPSDPARITFEDATALASLVLTSDRMSRSDQRLLKSVWQPVAELHDRRVAEAAVAQEQRPWPKVPATAVPALRDAILAEVPQLRPEEASGRAEELLEEAVMRRAADRARRLQEAHDRIAELDAATARRTETTRDTLVGAAR